MTRRSPDRTCCVLAPDNRALFNGRTASRNLHNEVLSKRPSVDLIRPVREAAFYRPSARFGRRVIVIISDQLMALDPSSIPAAWEIAKTAGDISKKLYEYTKSLANRDEKQQIDEILDQVRALKKSAAELEDENRNLREKLRFKSDEFEFKNPFWFEKAHPDRPLCAKCFANEIVAPMSEQYHASGVFRECLVCKNYVEVERGRRDNHGSCGGHGGPGGWMR